VGLDAVVIPDGVSDGSSDSVDELRFLIVEPFASLQRRGAPTVPISSRLNTTGVEPKTNAVA